MSSIGHNLGPPLTTRTDSGWVAIARAMRDHPIVGFQLHAKPCDPSRGAMQPALAWIDLIMECHYTAGMVTNNGRTMQLQRGQMVGATSWLANRWNWTPMAVRWWLEKLEKHEMITLGVPTPPMTDGAEAHANHNRSSEESHEVHSRSNNRSRGRFANIISIRNYNEYQISKEGRQQDQQQVEQHGDNRLAAQSHQVNNRLTYIENARAVTKEQDKEQESTPPTPLAGGEQAGLFADEGDAGSSAAAAATTSRGARSAKTRQRNAEREVLLGEALDLFNRAADHFQFSRCEVLSPARADRLAKRLEEIGGLERFRLALRAVGRDDFLAGRVQPRGGDQPFRLNIDRLLQTDGGLGDVLARLIELGQTSADPKPVGGKTWGWWRDRPEVFSELTADRWRQALSRAKPNGTWPWWKLGPPPGHAECTIPAEIVTEYGLLDKYRGQINAGPGATL